STPSNAAFGRIENQNLVNARLKVYALPRKYSRVRSWSELAMPFSLNRALAMTFMALMLTPVDVRAQTSGQANSGQALGTLTPSNGAPELTGKERLSEKWKDEQRIDNCKVPLDKRGPKARPDSCDHLPND